MKIEKALEFLESQKAKDKAFFAEKLKTTAATFCAECKVNKPTGLYPFWHKFHRTLCAECGKEYVAMLKEIKAFD